MEGAAGNAPPPQGMAPSLREAGSFMDGHFAARLLPLRRGRGMTSQALRASSPDRGANLPPVYPSFRCGGMIDLANA